MTQDLQSDNTTEIDSKMEKPINLIQALTNARLYFGEMKKSATVTVRMKSGGTYSYSYCPLNAILDAVFPALVQNGLYITNTLDAKAEIVSVVNGDQYSQPSSIEYIVLTTTIYHVSGESISSSIKLRKMLDEKSTASSITYWKRHLLSSLLSISPDDDIDGSPEESKEEFVTRKPLPQKVENVKLSPQKSKTVEISPERKVLLDESTDFMNALKLSVEEAKIILNSLFGKKSRQFCNDNELKIFNSNLKELLVKQQNEQAELTGVKNQISQFLEELQDTEGWTVQPVFEECLRKKFLTTSLDNLNKHQLETIFNQLLNYEFFPPYEEVPYDGELQNDQDSENDEIPY